MMSHPAWAKESVSQSTRLEDLERQLGPLEIKGQRFTVVLHKKRVRGESPPDADFGETLERLEIKDAAGTVHFQREFPYEVSGNSFAETWDASAQVLEGKQGSGLLLTYGVLPSTPLGGESWQVFGLFDGKLVPFSKPLFTEGQLINGQAGEPVVETSEEPNLEADVLHFRVWTGNLFVIVPLRLDWLQGKMGPAWRCTKMTFRGPRPVCRLSVEAERVPQEDRTFVRLYPEAEETAGIPQHAVVEKDSKVEFLAAETALIGDEDTEGVGLAASDDVWLKVRIDGKESWIHTQEDFYAIGLPMAG